MIWSDHLIIIYISVWAVPPITWKWRKSIWIASAGIMTGSRTSIKETPTTLTIMQLIKSRTVHPIILTIGPLITPPLIINKAMLPIKIAKTIRTREVPSPMFLSPKLTHPKITTPKMGPSIRDIIITVTMKTTLKIMRTLPKTPDTWAKRNNTRLLNTKRPNPSKRISRKNLIKRVLKIWNYPVRFSKINN